MKWIGRVALAVLGLIVLARAAAAQQAYPQQTHPAPPGYVKVDNPEDYLPGYPAGGIPLVQGDDGRYYPQAGYGQSGQAPSAQGGYPVVVSEPCCGGGQAYPVPQPQQPVHGGGYGYPAGGVVVVEETCCRGGGHPAPQPQPAPGYGYGQPIYQYVETVPCCAQAGGYSGGGYAAGGYYGTGYHPPSTPSPCCAPPAPPPSPCCAPSSPPTCDWRRPPHPQDPYACPPGWGEVRLNDSFFWGGGGVGPEYIAGGGGGGGAYVYAGAGASAYASASSSVRVSVGGKGGYRPPHRPPHKPPHGGGHGKKKGGCGGCR